MCPPSFFFLLTLFHRSEILLTEKAVGQNFFHCPAAHIRLFFLIDFNLHESYHSSTGNLEVEYPSF